MRDARPSPRESEARPPATSHPEPGGHAASRHNAPCHAGDWPRCVLLVLRQSVSDLFTDNGPQWAAAIAYYSLLSVFPLLLAAAVLASFVVDPDTAVQRATQLLGSFVPRGQDEIEQTVREALDVRSTLSLLSFGTLLWSGSRVFGIVTKALNIAFDVNETYGFWRRTTIEVVMLLTIGSVFVLALVSPWLIDLALRVLAILPVGQGVIARLVELAVPPLLLLGAWGMAYRFLPRKVPDWRAATVGAATAVGLFWLARTLFLGYLDRFGNYQAVYGSLAVVILLVLWAWIAAVIFLFGGEVASHVQHLVIEGHAPDEVERRHKARAPDA